MRTKYLTKIIRYIKLKKPISARKAFCRLPLWAGRVLARYCIRGGEAFFWRRFFRSSYVAHTERIMKLRLSTKGQYAVRAMVNLACHSECNKSDKPLSLKEISDEEGISLSYLEQLFVKLRKGRIVRSVRGPGGGYVLAKSPSEISVGEVIKVVEEPLNPVACLDEGEGCDRADTCITQGVWKKLAEKISEFLYSVTIEDLRQEARSLDGVKSGEVREACTT